MIYGKNGKFITIKKSELPLEQGMEKRLDSVREKKRPSFSNNQNLKKSGSQYPLSAYSVFSKFRLLPVVAFFSFALIIIRLPNFFDENQTNSDISVIATPAKAQENNAPGKKGSMAGKSSTKVTKAKAPKKTPETT